jgi:hypothetical protein
MADLDPSHHFFRHIKLTWMDGDFVEPMAFRLRAENGGFEKGLSTNWCEYFQKQSAAEVVVPLKAILEAKGRKIGKNSKFALLNVGASVTAARDLAAIRVVNDEEENDLSHVLVTGYEEYNDQVAERLAKVVQALYPASG